MSLGEVIKELLVQNSITQKHLAGALRIPQSTLGNYIQNTREPDCATLIRIADYFHVSIDFLLNHSAAEGLSHDEEKLLNIFRSMSKGQQELYLKQGEVFIQQNKGPT